MELLTEYEVLERVDEYSLYCFYMGYEPILGKSYPAPYRKDNVPSFGIIERRIESNQFPTELIWKDGAGRSSRGIKSFGDIFDLVQNMFRLYSRDEALLKICEDFKLSELNVELEGRKIILSSKAYKPPSTIIPHTRVKYNNRDLDYWILGHCCLQKVLDEYCVRPVDSAIIDGRLINYSQAYCYTIKNRHQIYSPFSPRRFKFRNNWTDFYIPGWLQRKGSDNLIITKAYKDVVCIASLGIDTDVIAPRGENILIGPEFIRFIADSYKNVIVLMDNDGKTSAGKYPFRNTLIPLETGCKDPAEYQLKFKRDKAHYLISKLLFG